MPIKGLTDRGAKFPEIGRIRKGAPKEPNRPGFDLTYFRVEFDEEEVDAAKTFRAHYGEKPAEIDIVLPFPTAAENFEAWREAYLAGGLIHRCDGETVQYAFDPLTGETRVKGGIGPGGTIVPCDGVSAVAYYDAQGGTRKPVFCKPYGRLKVILPVLRRAAYLTVLTSSVYDIARLTEQLMAYADLGERGLIGMPLILRRRPAEISRQVDGKKVKVTKSLLSIEADPKWVEQKLIAMRSATLPALLPGATLDLAVSHPETVEGEFEDDGPETDPSAPKEQGARPPVDVPASDGPTAFWLTFKKTGLEHSVGQQIVKELGDDFAKARQRVREQYHVD
jgi:hypothetical protein